MNRDTKSRNNKDTRRRSALSFIGGDGSLDIDHVLQSEPWKNIEKFKNSEAGCIQTMLDDFVETITQKNTIEAKEGLLKLIKGDTPAKKTPRSTKGSRKSPIKDLSTDLPGTSSSTNSNIIETNTTVNKNKTLKRQSRCDMEITSQKLSSDTDDVKEEIQKISEANVKENADSNKKMTKIKILQDITNITNITEKNLHTSTPKKVKKTVKKKESMAENKKPETKNSKNKSEKNIQCKEIQKKSKNAKEQAKNSINILEEEETPNVKVKNNLGEIIPQELSRNTDSIKKETTKCSKTTAKKNVNSNKKIKKVVQDKANITEKDLQISTSKKEASKIRKKKVIKEESTTENKNSKTGNSENKSEKNVQRKKIQKKSKSTKEQAKSSANMLEEEKKMNVNLKNNLECNKVNQNSSKNKVENKKVEFSATLLSKMENKCEVAEINNNMEKDAKSKEYNKSMSNQLNGKNLKKENLEDKLQGSAQLHTSLKLSQINNMENIKCQCKKNSAKKCSDNQCLLKTKEDYEKKKQRKKNLKAAKAIEDLSRRITVVKKKMECIKNDLESNESLNSDSFIKDPSCSSLSTFSSSSYSSHSSSCSCSSCLCSSCLCSSCSCYDTSKYSSVFSSSSGSSESSSETETGSETED